VVQGSLAPGICYRVVIHCHSLNISLGEIGIVAELDERLVRGAPDIRKVSSCHQIDSIQVLFCDSSFATIPRKTQIMNPALFGIVIIVAQFLVALALLFVAGSLNGIDLNRAEAADSRFVKRPSRFIRDLRGLEDALVKLFARSTESCLILRVLVAHRKPLLLVRMSRHGFLVTEVGREVHRRYDSARTVRDQCGLDRGSSTGHIAVIPQNRKLQSSDPRERCIAAAASNAGR
jgi:hypothetical protein